MDDLLETVMLLAEVSETLLVRRVDFSIFTSWKSSNYGGSGCSSSLLLNA